MLLLALSWLIATFVLLSIGDIFISLYNYITCNAEQYNLTDTLVLGICFVLFPLGIFSIWLPSNEIMLIGYIILSILYWLTRKKRLKTLCLKGIKQVTSLPKWQLILFATTILSCLTIAIWINYIFDAVNYQYQATSLYEHYKAIPGIANIESRIGFNSNYLLISSLFASSKIFGEPIFIIQMLFVTFYSCWLLSYVIKNKYPIGGLILLTFILIFLGANADALTTASTDILPSLFIFYLVSKVILSQSNWHNKYLFLFVVPLSLVTLKLSVAPITLLSLYPIYYLVKKKEIKTLSTLCLIGFTIIAPWIIRNVIISGYLIYPLSSIDLFNYDWKLPLAVAQLEQDYIKDYAWLEFQLNNTFLLYRYALKFEGIWASNKFNIIISFITTCISFIAYTLPLIVGYRYIFTKKRWNSITNITIITLILIMLVWLFAPSIRFISGTLFASAYLVITILISNARKTSPIVGKIVICGFAVIMLGSAAKKTLTYYAQSKGNTHYTFSSSLYKPYGIKEQKNIKHTDFTIHKMGEIDIYLSSDRLENAAYDYIPSTFSIKPEEKLKLTSKFYPIEGVESRGKNIRDGFRPIKGYDSTKWVREKDWWTKERPLLKIQNLVK